MSNTGPRFVSLKHITGMLNCSIAIAVRYAARPDFPDPYYFGGKKM